MLLLLMKILACWSILSFAASVLIGSAIRFGAGNDKDRVQHVNLQLQSQPSR